jgi:hypothetical protein
MMAKLIILILSTASRIREFFHQNLIQREIRNRILSILTAPLPKNNLQELHASNRNNDKRLQNLDFEVKQASS